MGSHFLPPALFTLEDHAQGFSYFEKKTILYHPKSPYLAFLDVLYLLLASAHEPQED